MNRQIATIARYTLLEAMRTRLPAVAAAAFLLLVAASVFIHEIALTESARMQTGFYAAGARFAAVFIAALYVVTSVTREFNDKGLELLLALDLPRGHYILGKLAGFVAVGALLAAAASLPLAWLATPAAALQWGLSLALETGIIVALALFCVITLSQLLPAAAFVLAFYLLARTLTAIRLMSGAPLADADSVAHQFMHLLVESLALVLPAFDRWTQTAWVVDAAPAWTDIATLALHGVVYVGLLGAAAMFDFYRKNF